MVARSRHVKQLASHGMTGRHVVDTDKTKLFTLNATHGRESDELT